MNSMILAASGLTIAINLLLVINVAICLLLCLLVLMQRPKQEGLGAAFGGGMTDQAFGARTTDVLQKGTVYLGTVFFIVTLVLSILVSASNADDKFESQQKEVAEKQLDDPGLQAELDGMLSTEPENTATEEETTPSEETSDEPAPAEETTPAEDTEEEAQTGAAIGAAAGGVIGHQDTATKASVPENLTVGGTTGAPQDDTTESAE